MKNKNGEQGWDNRKGQVGTTGRGKLGQPKGENRMGRINGEWKMMVERKGRCRGVVKNRRRV